MATTLPRSQELYYLRTGIRFKTAIILLLCITGAFAAGMGSARIFQVRPELPSVAIVVPPSDYSVRIPEGETTINITDPRAAQQKIASFSVERHGSAISDIPRIEKQISPREPLTAGDLAFFKYELRGLLVSSDSTWERANRIRSWLVRMPHSLGMPGLATRIPREAYLRMKQGQPVLCGNLAEIYVALCQAAGLTARTVGLTMTVADGSLGRDAHAGAELWIPELGGWIYEDPTFDFYAEVCGKPASALQIHDALMNGLEVRLARTHTQTASAIKGSYIDPRLYFRHLSYEYKAGGALLYFADARLEPLNLRDRNWIQTSNRADIERLDLEGNRITEQILEVSPGIFVQVIEDTLFVRDRREQARGIRVRSSNGGVQACSYEHWRAEELGLFSRPNLINNASFDFTRTKEAVAAGWELAGTVDVTTFVGGQGLVAQAGGKLYQSLPAKPGHSYIMHATLNAIRGEMEWSLGDNSPGTVSRGKLEAGRTSEIVSDVIICGSDQLTASFALPEGGSFRVLDVTVVDLSAADERFSKASKQTLPRKKDNASKPQVRLPSTSASLFKISHSALPAE